MKKILKIILVSFMALPAFSAENVLMSPCSLEEVDAMNEAILATQALLQQGENQMAAYLSDSSQAGTSHYALIEAIKAKDLNKVRQLTTPQNINSKDSGFTPLFVAIGTQDLDIIDFLLQKNANVNIPSTDSGTTPLMYACFKLNENIVDRLLQKSIDIRAKDHEGNTPIGYTYLGAMRKHISKDSSLVQSIIIKLNQIGIRDTGADTNAFYKCS